MTLAATVATAPLIAHDFERISLASIPANLLVAARGRAGHVDRHARSASLGQVPGIPTAPLGAVEGVLVDWIAARRPGAGLAGLGRGRDRARAGPVAVAIAYLRRIGCRRGRRSRPLRRRRRLAVAPAARVLAAGAVLSVLALALVAGSSGARPTAAGTLRVTASTSARATRSLLERARGDPVLIDAGPPGGAAAEALDRLGVDRARGGLRHPRPARSRRRPREVLAGHSVDAARPRPSGARARCGCTATPAPASFPSRRAARSGSAPSGSTCSGRRASHGGCQTRTPARSSSRRRSRGWDVLLTGDAEAEATPSRPGAVRRPQGRSSRQRRRRPRSAARPLGSPRRADRGRRRQLLRTPDRADARGRSPSTASAPCAPTSTATRRSSSGPAASRSRPPAAPAGGPGRVRSGSVIGPLPDVDSTRWQTRCDPPTCSPATTPRSCRRR